MKFSMYIVMAILLLPYQTSYSQNTTSTRKAKIVPKKLPKNIPQPKKIFGVIQPTTLSDEAPIMPTDNPDSTLTSPILPSAGIPAVRLDNQPEATQTTNIVLSE